MLTLPTDNIDQVPISLLMVTTHHLKFVSQLFEMNNKLRKMSLIFGVSNFINEIWLQPRRDKRKWVSHLSSRVDEVELHESALQGGLVTGQRQEAVTLIDHETNSKDYYFILKLSASFLLMMIINHSVSTNPSKSSWRSEIIYVTIILFFHCYIIIYNWKATYEQNYKKNSVTATT